MEAAAVQRAVDRQRMQRTRMEHQRQQQADPIITIQESAAVFHSKVAEGPVYACCCCERLQYRSAVIEMKKEKYARHAEAMNLLQSSTNVQTHGKCWICKTCHGALRFGKIPIQSWSNGLKLDEIPQELADLRPLEVRLLSQRIPFMKLVGLPRGGQKAIHGNAVNVPSRLQPVVSLLPRLPDSAEVIPLKLKRKLCYKGHYMHEYIRPKRVMQALRWLKENNPLYQDVEICSDWENRWRDDNPDLWEAMANVCDEDIERAAEPAATILNEPLDAASSFALPAEDHYSILKHLAELRNLKIRDVPGDGNCFFHAVSLSLPSAGVQSISGPEIRSQLVQFIENQQHSQPYFGFVEISSNRSSSLADNTLSQQQRQALHSYIDDLRHGQWADNLAVQGVADMLNINIEVINTITPEWTHKVHPRKGASGHSVTIGLMGEQHYVAFENVEPELSNHPQASSRSQEQQDNEDRIAFEQMSKQRGMPFDTLLQEEQVTDDDNTYSIAPGENQKPCPFLTDDKYEEMANPSKYPYGCGGLTHERDRKITPRKYFNQRLLHKDGRFASDIDYLLAAQYAVEAKQVRDDIQITLRQTRGQMFQNRRINAGLMKNDDNMKAMLRTDTAYRFMKNVRGTPAYWGTVLLDLLAMCRQLGTPTWFLTLSAADMQWPDVIQSIALQYGRRLSAEDVKNMSWDEKCHWLRCNPVTAARQFKHRLDLFFKDFIGGKSNPIGQLQDYMIRIEFQARGSPHAHTILWMKDAPKLDVNNDEEVATFIDKYQTCAIPPEEENDLRDLVLSLQKHVHSSTCRNGKSCRFNFPHFPSSKTVIARQVDSDDPSVVKQALDVKTTIFEKVDKVMKDKEVAEDISLTNLLQKAEVHPDSYQEAVQTMRSGKRVCF